MKYSRRALAITVGAALCAYTATSLTAVGTLAIYFIDVEGGQATLIVTPQRQSLLVDAGWSDPPGRDARRILAAAHDAGVGKLDYVLLSHFHEDHLGGVPELARHIEIGAFIDHDNIVGNDRQAVKPFNQYIPVRKKVRQHLIAKPGDRLPLDGVDAVVVSSAGKTLAQPLEGAGEATSGCREKPIGAHEIIENPRSTGFVLRFGAFRFLDLGDLSGKPIYALACPTSLIGAVDVYLVAHHGNDDIADAAILSAFKPRVAVLNNGANKGGEPKALKMLHRAALTDVWQLHRSENGKDQNFTEDRIANLNERTAHWIKLLALDDGSFTITNGRTGAVTKYDPR